MTKKQQKLIAINAFDKQKLFTLCEYIKANIQNEITWVELIEQSGLTHSEIIDLFKHINTTPMTYIRDLKKLN